MHHDGVSLHHKGLCGWWLPMQPSALGSGSTNQPPVVWCGLGAAKALRVALLAVAEPLVLPVAAATAPRCPSGLL